jgi:hypothetical protein
MPKGRVVRKRVHFSSTDENGDASKEHEPYPLFTDGGASVFKPKPESQIEAERNNEEVATDGNESSNGWHRALARGSGKAGTTPTQ